MNQMFKKYSPPGEPIKEQVLSYIGAVTVAFLFGLKYLFSFFDALESLYMYEDGKKVIRPMARMTEINQLMEHNFRGIWIILFFCLLMIASNYMSFYRKTKSIYVMKRLKDAKELHKRCLVLPILGFVAGIVFFAILLGLYVGIYYWVTPTVCIPNNGPLSVWRMIL